MAFWLNDGKIVTASGAPILAPVCPCLAPCDYRCTYCCDPELAQQYTLTLDDSFTLSTVVGDVTVSGPWTVDYMGQGDTYWCIWTSDTVEIGSTGYYIGAFLQYRHDTGVVYAVIIVSNSPDIAYAFSNRICCDDYPYECESPAAFSSACYVYFSNSRTAPDRCADAFSLTLPFDQNAGSMSPCSGGTGRSITIS